MTTPYIAQNPVNDFGQRFSKDSFSATLATSTNTQVTVTGRASVYKALIKAGADGVVYVALNETAEVPAGASFASTGSEMIPVNGVLCREVKEGDVLNFITAGTGVDVCVTLFARGTTTGI